MAEKAAHISYTTENKPSIFEIIAQNSLNVTLQPAFQKIVEFLSECSTKYFGWIAKYHEESFLAFNSLLQYYYLKHYDASFAEYFYGLRRTSIKGTILSTKEKHLSLLFLVVFPYVLQKLEERLNTYRIESAEGLLLNRNWSTRGKKLLLFSESSFGITWNLWILLNYMRYMSDQTESQHPILQLLKLKLVFSDVPEDIIAFWSSAFNGELKLKEFGIGFLQNGIRTFLEVGAFFMQFLQTWYQEKSNYSITALPVVPPPELDPKADRYKGKCPVCLQPWRIPTIVPVSGYVFCFSCIVKHLREEPRCPVTNLPAKPIDLVRIYDS